MKLSRMIALPACLLLAAAIPGPCSFNSYSELDCADDGRCPEGLTCGGDGYCKTAGVGTPPVRADGGIDDPFTGTPDCRQSGCPVGQECRADGACVPFCNAVQCEPGRRCDPAQNVPNCDLIDGECVGNEDCPDPSFVCEGNRCVPGCQPGINCFAPNVCQGGVCAPDPGGGCAADNDCAPGFVCDPSGQCQPGDTTRPCDIRSGTGCLGGEACNVLFPEGDFSRVEGVCTPPGGTPDFEACVPNPVESPCGPGSFCLLQGASSGVCIPFCVNDICGAGRVCTDLGAGPLQGCTDACGSFADCPSSMAACVASGPCAATPRCLPACDNNGCYAQCKTEACSAGTTCAPMTVQAGVCGGIAVNACR